MTSMHLCSCHLIWCHTFIITLSSDACVQNDQFLFSTYNNRGCFRLQRLFGLTVRKPPFDSPSVRLLISACFCSSSIHPPLSPSHHSFSLPPTRPLASFSFFSPGTGLICGLRVQRGIEGGRIGARKRTGRREET